MNKILAFTYVVTRHRVFFQQDLDDLGGGFKYFLFSSLSGEDSHFD